MYCDSLQDLKKMIMTSNLESVEKLVSTLEVDQQTKDGLIVLANDTMIMRLNKMKTWELANFKVVDLPTEVSKKIDEETRPADLGLLVGFGIFTFGFVKGFKRLIIDKNYDGDDSELMIMLVGGVVMQVAACISERIRRDSIIKFAHKRFNQLYENSIQIKQLMYTLKVA